MKCCSFFSKENVESYESKCEGCNCKKKILCIIITSLISFGISFLTLKLLGPKEFKNYLNKNPKSVIESIENMYKKEREEATKKAEEKVPQISQEISANPKMPFIGKADSKNIIIKFFDYSCGFCKKEAAEIKKLLEKNSDIKIIMADLPILSQNSLFAAQIGSYIFQNHKEKFSEYYHELAKAKSLDKNIITTIVKKLKLDVNIIEKAFKDEEIKKLLEKNYEYAKELAIPGTPAMIVNGKMHPNFLTTEDMQDLLNGKKENK